MNAKLAIEAKGLTKFFGRHKVLDSLSLRVERGTVYGFLGRNGAGKTTAIKMLLGLLAIGYGFLFYLGGVLVGLSPARWFGTRPAGLVAPVLASVPLAQLASLPTALVVLLASGLILVWANLATIEQRSF